MAQHQVLLRLWEATRDPDRILPLPELGCYLQRQKVRPAAPLSLLAAAQKRRVGGCGKEEQGSPRHWPKPSLSSLEGHLRGLRNSHVPRPCNRRVAFNAILLRNMTNLIKTLLTQAWS